MNQAYMLNIAGDGTEENGAKLFKRQRAILGNLLFGEKDRGLTEEEFEMLEGLQNLCDEIADQAHDNYGLDTLNCEEDKTMNITLQPTKPEPARTEKIIFNGVEIGTMTCEKEGGSYRLQINRASSAEGIAILYQGNGPTPETAMRHMIARHRGYARAQLARLDELEAGIFGEGGRHEKE